MPKTLKNIDVRKKRVLVRVDLNIPLGDNLQAIIPTLKYLIKQKAKIILISHMGRPKGKDEKLSLKPVSDVLGRFLKKKIIFSNDFAKKRIEMMNFGDILMLENIRFDSREIRNSDSLAKELAGLADVFINDAFAVSHREHASIVNIPKYLDSGIGLLFEKEINELNKIFKNVSRPLVAIIGGNKISTKIKLINKFLKIADKVLIGGALANTIFAAQGIDVDKSIIEKKAFSEIDKIDLNNKKLFLPIDLGVFNNKVKYVSIHEIKGKALDIGPKSIDLFSNIIKNAGTVIWNGPLGLYTQKPFDKSSVGIVKAIIKSKAYSIIGGGDTVEFLRGIKKDKKFNHISTGGGAMLNYLVDEDLVGLDALK